MSNSRYNRQTILEKIGESGQQKLLNASVCIVGCGGLGSIIAPYLAGAGVGHMTLVDGDIVDISNLHRQVFYSEESAGTHKAQVLATHCAALNPSISITVHAEHLTKNNIVEIINSCDVVLECTDEIYTKYLVNDYCFVQRIPMVYGAIYKYDGYVSVFENNSKKAIHLRDIFPSPQSDLPSCSEVGVLATIAGLTALIQANEAIKFITGIGESLVGKLLSYNVLDNKQLTLKLRKSYKKDMESIYLRSSYNLIREITWKQLQEKEDLVTLCILEKDEVFQLDMDYLHIPLSKWAEEKKNLDASKSYAVFCMSGKRSADLVKRMDGEFDLINITGGIKGIK